MQLKNKIFGIFITLVICNNTSAIVNGYEIDQSDPLSKSVIALQMKETLPDGSVHYYKGTGIIITNQIILTAGHNFFYLDDPIVAEAIFDPTPVWGKEHSGQIRISVKRAIVHPGFRQINGGTEDDLALVLLEKPIPPDYAPILLASQTSTIPALGMTAVSAGYGTDIDTASPPINSFKLRKTSEPLLSYTTQTFASSPKLWFDQSAGGICGGDSGGPAIFGHEVYGIAVHVAYNQKGQWSCLTKGAFTNVMYYSDWINSTLNILVA